MWDPSKCRSIVSPEASLIVPFTIFLYGSSCNYLFGLFYLLFSLSFSRHHILLWEPVWHRQRMQKSENKAEKERITWTGTIRLDSGFVPTGNRGGECDGSAPSLPAEPVQQTLRPRHERQRQRHQDQVRQSLLLPRVHHWQSQEERWTLAAWFQY